MTSIDVSLVLWWCAVGPIPHIHLQYLHNSQHVTIGSLCNVDDTSIEVNWKYTMMTIDSYTRVGSPKPTTVQALLLDRLTGLPYVNKNAVWHCCCVHTLATLLTVSVSTRTSVHRWSEQFTLLLDRGYEEDTVPLLLRKGPTETITRLTIAASSTFRYSSAINAYIELCMTSVVRLAMHITGARGYTSASDPLARRNVELVMSLQRGVRTGEKPIQTLYNVFVLLCAVLVRTSAERRRHMHAGVCAPLEYAANLHQELQDVMVEILTYLRVDRFEDIRQLLRATMTQITSDSGTSLFGEHISTLIAPVMPLDAGDPDDIFAVSRETTNNMCQMQDLAITCRHIFTRSHVDAMCHALWDAERECEGLGCDNQLIDNFTLLPIRLRFVLLRLLPLHYVQPHLVQCVLFTVRMDPLSVYYDGDTFQSVLISLLSSFSPWTVAQVKSEAVRRGDPNVAALFDAMESELGVAIAPIIDLTLC
jgi:hypothetical protein